MKTCKHCAEPMPAQGTSADLYHYDCSPTTCVCAFPMPATDGLGDCTNCHRLIVEADG